MKKFYVILAGIGLVLAIAYFVGRVPVITVSKSDDFSECANTFNNNLVDYINGGEKPLLVTIQGIALEAFDSEVFVSEDMKLMVETNFLRGIISCSVITYKNDEILIMKGDNAVKLNIDSSEALINNILEIDLVTEVMKNKDGKIFVPFTDIAEFLGYRVDYHLDLSQIDLVKAEDEKFLPAAYDMRDYGRTSPVRDQGRYGTCWAFASLGAFESTLLPLDKMIFSTDHMSMCNSYNLDVNKGGEHSMSIAYLAAWQGPVYEKDDPYGDGETNDSLKAVKHLEEALVLNRRDMEILKSAIFRYGGIETSLYMQMEYVDSVSPYYSWENAAYFYDGEEVPDHDVVVVGWDDNYPKENFTNEPEDNGAFICRNSWGPEFGEDGYFYVSYFDVNICNKSVVYTRIGANDNYDKIYQADLLGWVGQMGFGKEEAFFSNVYTAGKNEELVAASFYATDYDTDFEVYVVTNYESPEDLRVREFVASGNVKYAGYYTVDFPEPIKLDDNSEYAVIVKIKTKGVVHPIAIEYNADERTENFDIKDGEGYISLYGELWFSAEETQNCNVCLKAFTNVRED